MKFHGGGVGHQLTHEATCCLLDGCKTLDKWTFTLEHDCDLFEERTDGSSEDEIPMDDPHSAEEERDEGGKNDGSKVEDGEKLIDGETWWQNGGVQI